jgi:hypothetical protein
MRASIAVGILLVVTTTLGAPKSAAAVTVYYTSPKSNEVYVTDGRTTRPLVSNVTRASGIALGPDGNLYVSEEGGNRIDRFTLTGARSGGAFGIGRRYTSITFGPDGLLYANTCGEDYANGYVRRYDAPTGQPRGSGITTAGDVAQYSPWLLRRPRLRP